MKFQRTHVPMTCTLFGCDIAGNLCPTSRGAAEESSPWRKPWEAVRRRAREPRGGRTSLSPLRGLLGFIVPETHGLRHGLLSSAAPRLMLLLLLTALAGQKTCEAEGAATKPIVVNTASLTWETGQRLTVAAGGEVTPDGQPSLQVTLAGAPSPESAYSDTFSLIASKAWAEATAASQDATVSKITFWLKALRPSSEPFLFVVRRGFGDRVALTNAKWQKVTVRNWGTRPLKVGELKDIVLRTAALSDGAQFLLGPMTAVLVDEAAEAARWIPVGSGKFTVDGLWWFKENKGELWRLPGRADTIDSIQRGVLNYAKYPTGARVRFKTDSTTLSLRVDHGGDKLTWKELSVMAMAGIELYEGPPERMMFRTISKPLSGSEPYVVDFKLGDERQMREWTLYLPMYAKLHRLDLAIDSEAQVEPPTPHALSKPVVFYGTSFIQGGCASRASMNLPALVGRKLAVDIINLGFAGDGRCELEMANFMAEIDAACFVMGPILNNPEVVTENYPQFVARLRQRWPERPILLMTRLHTVGQAEPYGVNGLVREVYEKMRAAGDRDVYYFDSFVLYRDGSVHPTVEGTHPSDLGFSMIAEALTPEVAKILRLPVSQK